MFKITQVLHFPGRSMMPPTNQFRTYSVAMPAHLLPMLQSRLTCLLIQRLYGIRQPHDLSYNELLDLDRLLSEHQGADAHNLVLDGRLLSLLTRFLEAERVILGRSRPQVMLMMCNADVWVLLGDLLESVLRPTQVVPLSFYGRA